MKNYYGNKPVDADDNLLFECIQAGVVPEGCKLGGQLAYKEHISGRDPCISICPHENRAGEGGCGGRIRTSGDTVYDHVDKAWRAKNDAVSARQALSMTQCKYLDKVVAIAERRRDEGKKVELAKSKEDILKTAVNLEESRIEKKKELGAQPRKAGRPRLYPTDEDRPSHPRNKRKKWKKLV